MATYNGGATLARAIDSIINQSYQNLELIIVDDASDLSTNKILAEYEKANKDLIKVFRNQKNIGLARSLNIGFSKAEGQYFARMDDDDSSELNRLELQVKYLEQNKDIDLVGTGMKLVDNQLNFIGVLKMPANDKEIKKFFIKGNPICHPTVMMRRSFFEKSGGYDEKLRRQEDLELWGRMANSSKYSNIEEALLIHTIKKRKSLKIIPIGIKIRFLNSRRMNTVLKTLPWIFIYIFVEMVRHFGYVQKKFRKY
jgi:glycosyltransferase EpsE